MGEIRVVVVSDGRGICSLCGNGLWPGRPPCEHKLEVASGLPDTKEER